MFFHIGTQYEGHPIEGVVHPAASAIWEVSVLWDSSQFLCVFHLCTQNGELLHGRNHIPRQVRFF